LSEPRPTGLKPTLRQMMVFVLWAALLAAATRAALDTGICARVGFICLIAPILFGFYAAPFLLILLWLLDRRGHVRNWYCSMCLVAGGILAAALFLLQDPACYLLTGRPTLIFPMGPLLSVGCLFGAWKQWQVARPSVCPNCGRRSVITIAWPIRPGSKRRINLGKHGWCASCGGEFERKGMGAWVAKG
jgi:hypothetical protein